MERIKPETVVIETPSKYSVTLKKKLTYKEAQAITNAMMGDMEVMEDSEDFKLKVKEANQRTPYTVFYHIVDWDITENNVKMPITIDTVEDVFDEIDMNFLMKEIEKFKPVPKKEIGS